MTKRRSKDGSDGDPFEIQHPHDGLFGYVFSDPENARVVLQGALPAETLEQLDLERLVPQRTKSHGASLAKLEGDLVFETRLRGGQPALVRLVIEHQSTQDWLMAWRVHQYKVRDTATWLARNRKARALPPVLAVVVYHGEEPWQAPRRLTQLYDLPRSQLERFGDGLAEDTYALEDLGTRSEAELLARPGPPAARLALALMREVKRKDADVLGLLRRAAPVLRELRRSQEAERTFVAFVIYIGATAAKRINVVEFRNLARDTMGEQGEQAAMTLFDRLRIEGSLTGQRGFLLDLLEQEFGPLPEDARARVEAGSEAELRRWGRRCGKAVDLGEVFAD